MERDPRYQAVRALIRAQEISKFKCILSASGFPRTELAKYMHANNNRMLRLIENPSEFTIREIDKMAEYFCVEPVVLISLINTEYQASKRPKETNDQEAS